MKSIAVYLLSAISVVVASPEPNSFNGPSQLESRSCRPAGSFQLCWRNSDCCSNSCVGSFRITWLGNLQIPGRCGATTKPSTCPNPTVTRLTSVYTTTITRGGRTLSGLATTTRTSTVTPPCTTTTGCSAPYKTTVRSTYTTTFSRRFYRFVALVTTTTTSTVTPPCSTRTSSSGSSSTSTPSLTANPSSTRNSTSTGAPSSSSNSTDTATTMWPSLVHGGCPPARVSVYTTVVPTYTETVSNGTTNTVSTDATMTITSQPACAYPQPTQTGSDASENVPTVSSSVMDGDPATTSSGQTSNADGAATTTPTADPSDVFTSSTTTIPASTTSVDDSGDSSTSEPVSSTTAEP